MQEIKLFIGFTDSKGHYYCILKHSKTLPKRLRKLIDTTRTSSRTIQIRHAPQAKFREPFCTCTTAYRGLIELAPARLEAEALGAHELEARKHHLGVLENERLLHLLPGRSQRSMHAKIRREHGSYEEQSNYTQRINESSPNPISGAHFASD